MIEDIDLERCKVSALKAMKLGKMRLDRIETDGGKSFFVVTSATTEGVEFRLQYVPVLGRPGVSRLLCDCVLCERDLLCPHIGTILLAGFPYEMSQIQATLMDVCLDAADQSEDGCPHVWREALEAAERGEDIYHWTLGD